MRSTTCVSNRDYQDFVLAYGLGFLRKETEAGDQVVAFYDPTKPKS